MARKMVKQESCPSLLSPRRIQGSLWAACTWCTWSLSWASLGSQGQHLRAISCTSTREHAGLQPKIQLRLLPFSWLFQCPVWVFKHFPSIYWYHPIVSDRIQGSNSSPSLHHPRSPWVHGKL
jgi:hypothetical protein